MQTDRRDDDTYLRQMRESLSVPRRSRATRLKWVFAIPVLAMVFGFATYEQLNRKRDPLLPPVAETAKAENSQAANRKVFGDGGRPVAAPSRPAPAADERPARLPSERQLPERLPDDVARERSAPPADDRPTPAQNSPAENAPTRATETASALPADLSGFLDQWRRTLIDRDLDAQVALYAPAVGRFFNKRNVSRDDVRSEKKRFLNRYPEFVKYDVSDIRVESMENDRAVLTFRKEWDARGRNRFAGAERQRLTLVRDGRNWQIVGEEELKVYWVRRT